VLACALGYVGWRVWIDRPEPLEAVALTTMPGAELFPSFSPDGNHVTFSWNGPNQDNPDIYVQMIGSTGDPLRLTTDPASDYNPVWSPDGRWIAFLRTNLSVGFEELPGRNEVRLVPPLGGTDRLLAEVLVRNYAVKAQRLAWCPDSKCLIVTDSPGEGKPDALFLVSLETGEKRQITNPKHPNAGDSNPAVAPNGRSMVFRRNIGYLLGELYWTPMGEGFVPKDQPRRLTHFKEDASFPAWTPDGKEVLFSSKGNLWRMNVHGGRPAARLPFVGQDGMYPVVSQAAGGKSRLVYVRNLFDINFWRAEQSGAGGVWEGHLDTSLSSSKLEHAQRFSPDGRKIAFQSTRTGNFEIWTAWADGSHVYQLTSMGGTDTGSPRWSPDGQWITYDSNVEGHYEVYRVAAAGGKPRRITFGSSHNQVPSFSADGRSIYFSSNRSGDYHIWKMPAQGGEAVQITQNGGGDSWETPDGKDLYYWRPGAFDLWRVPVSGGQAAKVIEDLDRIFVLFQDGLYYSGEHGHLGPQPGELRFFDFATGVSTTLLRNLGGAGPAVSPDRRTIIYTRIDSTGADLMLVENFK
jgi:Tol biopolymer transport system component